MTENSLHYKRFIFDFDDTISHCTNRDFDNAVPDIELIEKINKLFEEGYEIWIVTARGMLSCKGDLALREQTYRNSIETWLRNNNVHYHHLSFQKELGAYYVDDKALTISDFKNTEFKIKRGLSGNEVFITDDKVVSKTCDNALTVAMWHERALDLQYHVPKVHSVIGKTLNLEFVKGNSYKPGTIRNKLCDLAESFMNYSPIQNADFSTYANRVKDHLQQSEIDIIDINKIYTFLYFICDRMDAEKSFCHGDFTVDNLIITQNSICLIDPNPIEYSSWLLDISKLAHSFRRFGYLDDLKYVYSRYDEDRSLITLLELTHWVRILKYIRHSDVQLYTKALNIIEELLEQC